MERSWYRRGNALKNNHHKGYLFTLEVIIAVSLIMVSMVIIFSSTQAPASAKTALIKKQGFEALEYLDQAGELRFLAFSGNEITLEEKLKALLPSSISLETDVCTDVCAGNVPSGTSIITVDYYVSGYRDAFFTKKIKLWMWGSS